MPCVSLLLNDQYGAYAHMPLITVVPLILIWVMRTKSGGCPDGKFFWVGFISECPAGLCPD